MGWGSLVHPCYHNWMGEKQSDTKMELIEESERRGQDEYLKRSNEICLRQVSTLLATIFSPLCQNMPPSYCVQSETQMKSHPVLKTVSFIFKNSRGKSSF